MSKVLDYSLARPAPSAIKAAGYVGVMRYLAPAEDMAKCITAEEYRALRGVGLAVGLNWEWYGNRAREGAAAGHADATEALRQAEALGYRGAIYFSVDYNAPESDQPGINAYFTAVAEVGKERVKAAYGGYWPLSRLLDAGLITYAWQTVAWSASNRESRAHLLQTGAGDLGGDVNEVLKADWNGLPVPIPATKARKGGMLLQHPTDAGRVDLVYLGKDGNIYHAQNKSDGMRGLPGDAKAHTQNLGRITTEAFARVDATWNNSGGTLQIVAQGVSGQLYALAVNSAGALEMPWTTIVGAIGQ